jgi:hypothetical protein
LGLPGKAELKARLRPKHPDEAPNAHPIGEAIPLSEELAQDKSALAARMQSHAYSPAKSGGTNSLEELMPESEKMTGINDIKKTPRI